MNANAEALRSLLADISELGAVAEDQGINRIPSFDPMVERAHGLGLEVPSPATLDDLFAVVEAAYADLEVGATRPNGDPSPSNPALGNTRGVPGAGP